MDIGRSSTIPHSVENSLWQRLWTCRKTDCRMIRQPVTAANVQNLKLISRNSTEQCFPCDNYAGGFNNPDNRTAPKEMLAS